MHLITFIEYRWYLYHDNSSPDKEIHEKCRLGRGTPVSCCLIVCLSNLIKVMFKLENSNKTWLFSVGIIDLFLCIRKPENPRKTGRGFNYFFCPFTSCQSVPFLCTIASIVIRETLFKNSVYFFLHNKLLLFFFYLT